MWSLKQTLSSINGHFPAGFDPKRGIKSLFPPAQAISITALSNYVFAYDYKEDGNLTALYVRADGAGRWFLGWLNSADYFGYINPRYQAGFVFLFSTDGFCRGFVDTSRPASGVTSCCSGTDPWIAANWPKIFAAGVHTDMQEADGTVSLPDESVIWTQVGFAPDKFVALAGTPGHCDYFAGSTEFPIEGWNGGSFRVYGE